jgi:hypothetical protein
MACSGTALLFLLFKSINVFHLFLQQLKFFLLNTFFFILLFFFVSFLFLFSLLFFFGGVGGQKHEEILLISVYVSVTFSKDHILICVESLQATW